MENEKLSEFISKFNSNPNNQRNELYLHSMMEGQILFHQNKLSQVNHEISKSIFDTEMRNNECMKNIAESVSFFSTIENEKEIKDNLQNIKIKMYEKSIAWLKSILSAANSVIQAIEITLNEAKIQNNLLVAKKSLELDSDQNKSKIIRSKPKASESKSETNESKSKPSIIQISNDVPQVLVKIEADQMPPNEIIRTVVKTNAICSKRPQHPCVQKKLDCLKKKDFFFKFLFPSLSASLNKKSKFPKSLNGFLKRIAKSIESIDRNLDKGNSEDININLNLTPIETNYSDVFSSEQEDNNKNKSRSARSSLSKNNFLTKSSKRRKLNRKKHLKLLSSEEILFFHANRETKIKKSIISKKILFKLAKRPFEVNKKINKIQENIKLEVQKKPIFGRMSLRSRSKSRITVKK